ncbi:MAG: cation diffusion facilitator family transporter [Alphaproteobacteria bacterium]
MTQADINDRLRRRATLASVSVAGVLILLKLGAYTLTGSVALLASLIDSSVDAMASIVTLIGVRYALQPPDTTHRYGHGKGEALAAIAQALFIAGSGVLLTYQAISRLFVPELIRQSWIGITVMLISIVLTLALVLYQRHVVRRTGSVAISADSLHYRGDVAMNLAVIAAIVLAERTGLSIFDPIFAIGIAAYLILSAFRIGGRSLDMLMDRELPADQRRRIREIVTTHPETRGVHDMRTRNAGDRYFIEFHLELDRHLTLEQAHDITDAVEAEVMAAFPNAEVLIHQEPEGLEDDRLDRRLRR